MLEEKLIEHRAFVNKNGQDMPEIRNWKWNQEIKQKRKMLTAEEN